VTDLGVLMRRISRPLCGNWLLKVWENLLILSQIYKSVYQAFSQ